MGLVAIFAAAPIPIFIMGSLLEASKLVVASWLYRSWKEVPLLLKTYFTMALIVLMVLTSMGIFGYLSKAHLDQAIPSGDVAAKLSLIDEKIRTEKENLNANRKELIQLDQQVDQTIARTDDAKGTERAIAVRRSQQKDRARILTEIGTTQTKIAKLNEERAPIATEVRKVEAEVGPIKYIAALIYGDNPDSDILEKAVRWVIIMIVIVFDPLAVLMLVAANWQQRKDKEVVQEEPTPAYVAEVTMPEPEPENPEETNKWEKFTDKLKWSNVFTNPVPLPTDAKEIMNEFFQKNEPVAKPEVVDKTVWYHTAGHRLTPEDKTTIEKDVEGLQKPI
jgi:flagellar basal body-associated protein FliL